MKSKNKIEQVDTRNIDWTERRAFMYKGKTINLNFDELLQFSRKIFDWLMFVYHKEPVSREDIWQECSIRCMYIFAMGKPVHISAYLKKSYSLILDSFKMRERYRRHLSLNASLNDNSDTTYIEFLAVYDKYFNDGLDWSVFTDKENELIDTHPAA